MIHCELNRSSPKNLWIEIFISIRFYKNDRFYYNNTKIKLEEKDLWIPKTRNCYLKECNSRDSDKELSKIFIQVFKLRWDSRKNLSKIEWITITRNSFSSRLRMNTISWNYYHRYGVSWIYHFNDSYHFRSNSSNFMICNHLFQEIQHLCNIKHHNRLRGWWLMSCNKAKDSEMQCTSDSKTCFHRFKL